METLIKQNRVISYGTLLTITGVLIGLFVYSKSFSSKKLSVTENPKSSDSCLQSVQGYNVNVIRVSTTTEAGVVISFPSSLSVDKNTLRYSGNYTITNFEGAYLNGGIIPKNGVEIVLSAILNSTTSLDDLLTQQLKDASNVVKGRITVDGIEAKCVSYNESFSPIEMHFVEVYVPLANTIYKFSLAFNSGDHHEAEFLSIYKDILVSVKLPKSETSFKTEFINGIPVPPEPDPKINNATLAGVDVDNDGIRDDVQRFIVRTYPQSEKARAALSQYTKVLQFLMLNQNSPAQDASLRITGALDCISVSFMQSETDVAGGNAASSATRALKVKVVNTPDRVRAYAVSNERFGGMAVTVPSFADKMRECQTSPSSFAN